MFDFLSLKLPKSTKIPNFFEASDGSSIIARSPRYWKRRSPRCPITRSQCAATGTIVEQFTGLVAFSATIPTKLPTPALSKTGVQRECLDVCKLMISLTAHRCIAKRDALDIPSTRRSQEHTLALLDTFDHKRLWTGYGIVSNLIVSASSLLNCMKFEKHSF